MPRPPFVTGLPLTDAEKPPERSVSEIVARAIQNKKRRRSERFFSSPSTPATVRAMKRMLGEREEDAEQVDG